MASDQLKAPKASKGDVAHTLVKAGLSAIPMVGGPAAELFQQVIQPPLERRRHEWMEEVGEKLQELEDRGVDISKLGENEEFVSAAMHASQLALRTHQKEKRDALRNALLNVAGGHSPGEALQQMFFDWIDTMSALHIQILRLFQAPTAPPNMGGGGLSSVLEHNMPNLRGSSHIYGQVWKDLYMRGLLNTDGLNVMMTGSGLAEKRTTKLGDTFLQFIAEPA